MRFDLAALASRNGYKRAETEFRPIVPPKVLGGELARIYLENIKAWEAAAPRIVAEYSRALSRLQRDYEPPVQSEIERATEETTGKGRMAKIGAAIAAWLARLEKWHRTQWILIVRITEVDLVHFLAASDVAPTLDLALARNAALVKGISTEAAGRISDIVYRGLQAGTPVTEVAAEIQEAVGLARKRSIRVAYDQMVKASGALDVARFVQAGIEEYVWKHTPQPHPRLHHLARDGKKFKLGSPRGDEPGMLPFCRCYRRAVLDLPKK